MLCSHSTGDYSSFFGRGMMGIAPVLSRPTHGDASVCLSRTTILPANSAPFPAWCQVSSFALPASTNRLPPRPSLPTSRLPSARLRNTFDSSPSWPPTVMLELSTKRTSPSSTLHRKAPAAQPLSTMKKRPLRPKSLLLHHQIFRQRRVYEAGSAWSVVSFASSVRSVS